MPDITSPNDTVAVEVRDAVAWITLNRPQSLNALNRDLVAAMIAITTAIRADATIRAVVLRGAGDHFMAGGDIKFFHDRLDAEPDKTAIRHEFEGLLNDVHAVILNMRAMPQPILASVRGAVAGAGVSFMLACDLVLATEDAFFTLAYCHLGVSPDGGSTFALPRMVGLKRAFEITLLGDRFDAATAERWGLINKVVAETDLGAETDEIASRLASGPTHAHAHAKALLNASLERGLVEQLDAETAAFADCTTTDNFAEGVDAFINKRKPSFSGE